MWGQWQKANNFDFKLKKLLQKIPWPFDLYGSESEYGSTDGIQSGSPSVAENNKSREFPLRSSKGIKFELLLFKNSYIFKAFGIDVKLSQHKAKNNIFFTSNDGLEFFFIQPS